MPSLNGRFPRLIECTLRWLAFLSLGTWIGFLLYWSLRMVILTRRGLVTADLFSVAVLAAFALGISFWVGFRSGLSLCRTLALTLVAVIFCAGAVLFSISVDFHLG